MKNKFNFKSIILTLTLLTLGVGQMWAGRRVYCYGKTTAPNIYIWNSETSSDNSSNWDQQRDMTLVEGTTDLWYFDLTTTGNFKCIFRDKDKNKYHKNDIEVTQDNMAYNLPGSSSDASGNQIFLYTEDAVLYFKMSSWWTDDGSPTCQTLTFAKYNGNNTSRIPINRLQKYLDNNSDDLDNTTKGENNLEMFATIPAGAYRYSMTYYRGNSNSTQWNTGTITSFDIAKNKDNTAITSNSHTPSWTTDKPTSTGSVEADETDVLTNTAVTLTPSLTSNLLLNKYKSVVYSVSPGTSGTDWTIAGNTFTPKVAGTYTITATITYYAKGFPSLTSTVAPTVTITASNPAADYTVTYDVHSSGHGSLAATYTTGGASIGASPATVTSGSGLTFTASPNSYYKVEAWYTNAACNAGSHNAGETTYSVASLSSDLNVYVKFEPITYSITYHLNGGTNHVSNPSSYNYTTSTITLQAPTKTGYTFGGWYDNSSFTGSAVTTIPNHSNGNKEYWAKWTINSYNITYSPASAPTGATYTTTPSSANYNSTVDVVVTPTAANYLIQVTAVDAGSNTVTVTNPSANTYRFTMPASNVTVTVTATTLPVVYVLKTKHANSSLGDGATGFPSTGQIWAWKFSGGNNFYTAPGDFPGPSASSKATAITDDIIGDEWYRFIPDNTSYFDGSTAYHVILTSTNQILDTETTFIENGSSHSAATHTGTIWIVPHGTDANTADLYTSYPDEIATPYNTTYYAGDHGSINVFGTTITSGNSQTIATTKNRTLTATPASGYEFNRWITSGSVTVADATSATTTVSATGAGGTVTATYFEAVNSGWYIMGDPAGSGWNVPTSLPLNRVFPGETNVYYRPVTLPANDQYFRFWNDDGNSTQYGADNNNQAVTKGTKYNLNYNNGNAFKYSAGGTVWFVVDASGATKKCWLQDPVEFYSVNFGYGSGCNTFSAKDGEDHDLVSGNTYVSGTALTFTQTPRTGYNFVGWNTAADGSGDELGTGSSYSVASLSGDVNVYAIYTENKTAITITTDGHGTITTPDPNESPYSLGVATTQAINASASTGYHWNTWTVSGTAALGTTATTASNTAKGNGTNGGTGTVTATFSPNTYRVQFHRNGGSGSTVYQNFTYDVAQNLTANTYTKTGYNFAGWALTKDGAVTYANGAEVSNLTTTNEGIFHLYAKWTPKQSALTFDYQISAEGYGASGSIAAVSATYGAAMPTLSGNMPTAANGYAFIGFFSETGGNGTKYYNADKSSAHNWDVDTESGTTLYAYYKKAEITNLVLSASTMAPNTSVTATPTISPTPVGPTLICWKILRSNGNLLTKEGFSDAGGNAVSFSAPETSGSYKVACVLRTGSDCDAGTVLDSVTVDFVVAGAHVVTVRYQDGDGRTLAASTSMEGRPLDWSGTINPPTVIGYTFDHWVAGDGVTMSTDGSSPVGSNTTTTATIYIKASYDGNLTAVYTKKNMIYFNNTLGWSDVYVYFYTSEKYWANDWGTGAYAGKYFDGQNPYENKMHGHMTQIEGTNIWYFDYTAAGYSTYANVAFANMDKSNDGTDNTSNNDLGFFSNTTDDPIQVARRGDHKSSLPMFVPLAGQPKTKLNNSKAEYSNQGYWMNYPENTGYTLKIYNTKTKDTPDELQSIPFKFTADMTMPMELTVELNANREYGFEIHREDGEYFGYDTKVLKINASGDEGESSLAFTGTKRTGIQTSVAGEYIFRLNYGDISSVYNYLVGVHYPVAVNDYRIIYKDNATWSNGEHGETWYHPSRAIHKENGAEDIVSFYISKADGASASMTFQYASAIDANGVVTWTDVASGGSIDLSGITESGVYNFYLKQSDGTISVDKIEAYTGNYYIRTDLAGTSGWDNYRATDHLMTYSEFSKSRETNKFGELYTHYYMKWCERGKNVKFVIANNYSSCVSDTLESDLVDLGNLSSGGWLKSDGAADPTSDKYSANIRFMYDERTNKVSRAYMSSSTNTARQFLVLKGNANFWNSDGTNLTGSGESHANHEAIFKDNEDWIYERMIKLTPGSLFKLYACYAQADVSENGAQHFRGTYADGAFTKDVSAIELIGGEGSTCNARIIYDFKTNRLIAAYLPDGSDIDGTQAIKADLMMVREHQGAGQQLTFKDGDAKLTDVYTVYGVMRFNRWILNNRANPTDYAKDHSDTDAHISEYHPLLDAGSQKSIAERGLYWISFPFDVNLSEVFGFGTYGTHWIMMRYNGAERARIGYWKDNEEGFWEYIWDRKGVTLEAGQGYVLALELDLMAANDNTFWPNGIQQVELFFPSTASAGTIKQTNVDVTIPAHECTIDRRTDKTKPDWNKDRHVADSHWNIIGVPSYANYGKTLSNGSSTITWNTWSKAANLPFLYEWNANDNTYTVQSGTTYAFKAMHAYYVQYHGTLRWSLASATPSSIVARRTYADEPQSAEFRLELQQGGQKLDQTFVKLNDDEETQTSFVFGEDMNKEFNAGKANIYSFIEGYMPAAGNSLPMNDQTTVVPVGVKTVANGEYTFAMPEGTNGIAVTLIDNETGVRTNLGLTDYTVTLTAGTYDQRFTLEIPAISNTPTDIELINDENDENGENGVTGARKVLIDNKLFIITEDGKVFDARGAMVKSNE